MKLADFLRNFFELFVSFGESLLGLVSMLVDAIGVFLLEIFDVSVFFEFLVCTFGQVK